MKYGCLPASSAHDTALWVVSQEFGQEVVAFGGEVLEFLPQRAESKRAESAI